MATVHGDLKGIKAGQIKQLEQLYEERLPSDRFLTSEFAEKLTHLSQAIHQPLCCYLNRRGQVIRVSVGTPVQTQLPEIDLPRRSGDRLSGIHCLAAQFNPPEISALIAMLRQRLDALVLLKLPPKTNKLNDALAIQQVHLAHLVPDVDQPWIIEALSLESLLEQEFDDLLHEWEKDIQNAGYDLADLQIAESDHDRVLLVGLITDSTKQDQDNLTELVRLVESAGGEVVGTVQQKRSNQHRQTVIGQGKLEEITQASQRLRANLIVFNQDISATQARNLEEQIGLPVVDRTEVILDIFAQRARSHAGKIQVELAQLKYLLPRLRGQGQAMSRLGAGIGTRGPGETKLETERRIIKRRLSQLQQEVKQLQAHRARLRQHRERKEMLTIALVGYTNAGKSTLLNALTQSEVYAADQLFATLDPTTRRFTISIPDTHERHELLLTDTVGFIEQLPPALMDAFRATLEEVTEADTLIHVVDLSHRTWIRQMQSVAEVLSELPATPAEAIVVFNKIDRTDSETLALAEQAYPDALFISATKKLGFETLRQRLVQLVEAKSRVDNAHPTGYETL